VASILGQRAEDIRTFELRRLGAVALLHAGGFFLGYWAARWFSQAETASRTISIEVGRQNSGLGAVLAKNSFPTLPAAVRPWALSAVFHSLIGSALAGWWRWRRSREAVDLGNTR